MLDELISPVQFPAGSTLYPVPVGSKSVPTILTALITAVPATVAACTGFMAWKAQRDAAQPLTNKNWPTTGDNGIQTGVRAAINTLVKTGDIEAAHTLAKEWGLPVSRETVVGGT